MYSLRKEKRRLREHCLVLLSHETWYLETEGIVEIESVVSPPPHNMHIFLPMETKNFCRFVKYILRLTSKKAMEFFWIKIV